MQAENKDGDALMVFTIPPQLLAEQTFESSKRLTTFHLFHNLPIEIMSLIISSCHPFDAVCLSITSYLITALTYPVNIAKNARKLMYTLTRPLLLRRNPKAYSLQIPECNSYETHRCAESGIHQRCTNRMCDFENIHCGACSLPPRHPRLLCWIPKTLKWCGNYGCSRFVVKKKLHKGRCLHRHPKPKKQKQALTFTYVKSKGGWARTGRIWSAMHREKHLGGAICRNIWIAQEGRGGGETGYNLRQRPRATEKVLDYWRGYQ